jgi:hypothetical protein
MGSDGQFRSFAKFLYTQNPFYLISCGLIIYGLQLATQSYPDLISRSILLTVSLGAYTLLMALTSVGVIRLGKVWDDARSILLVMVISQLALSTGVDELCNSNWKEGGRMLLLGGVFSLAITEFVLWSCRIRLPSWYRLSYYALLLVFFAMPAILGRAVEERHVRLTNWGAPLFSVLIGAALLLLAPAIRRGRKLVRRNGTPWRWPLFPLSAFAIIGMLACLRTHAIWMSFGYLGAAARFEPFLLLPIALACLVLLLESDVGSRVPVRGYITMACAPALLSLGTSRGGLTYLPIRSDLQIYCGSAMTVTLLLIIAFYAYAVVRRVPFAGHAFAFALMALGLFAELPEIALNAGLQRWMITLLAAVAYLLMCLRSWRSDVLWLVFSVVSAVTIFMAADAHEAPTAGAISAGSLLLLAMLLLGACFATRLAIVLRQLAAVALVCAAVWMVAWHAVKSPGSLPAILLLLACGLTLAYVPIVKRLGWLYVFGVQVVGLSVVFVYDGYQAGAFSGANLPIKSGLLCFLIGVAISSLKTGVYQKLLRPTAAQKSLSRYQWGL